MLLRLAKYFPDLKSVLLAIASAILLILAFPDFDYWFLAWFALVPLIYAVERERASVARSFVTGWLFGTVFFYGTCWWLTFAPINYAGFPWWLAYFLLLCVCLVVGLFPALFAGILSTLLRRFGAWAYLAAPFVWVFTEFLRYWLTGNTWNAIGYSQFNGGVALKVATVGGVFLTGAFLLLPSSFLAYFAGNYHRFMGNPKTAPFYSTFVFSILGWPALTNKSIRQEMWRVPDYDIRLPVVAVVFGALLAVILWGILVGPPHDVIVPAKTNVIAIQPNVPMAGLDYQKWEQLRERQIAAAEAELRKLRTTNNEQPTTVILPESPMNFAYNDDREFQQYIGDFARRNNVSVLFNSAEPDVGTTKYFNSAVMVGPDGKEAAQYDKIYLLPFGEAVPRPLEGILPGFVGNFAYGREYDILPVGDAKAGVMICFESHFGQLSREFVRNGADVLIEMTNDGYLGPTPVLRQHLANAVFRAVETNRPVLRVTNVGITAYINERGQVLDEAPTYQEATRVWSVSKSDGSQTFYVKYGDWFAWLSTMVTVILLGLCILRRREAAVERG